MENRSGKLHSIGDLIAEKTIQLDTLDPVVRSGFTQVPNFILTDAHLGLGAKLIYALFLHYAWHKDSCFPGQGRLGEDIGMSRTRVNEFIQELERAGLVEITRRGQGKTNIYKIKFMVKPKGRTRKS